MGLRFEAWTLPWSGTFERVIADIPAQPGSSGLVRLSEYGEAAINLHEDYGRLDDIVDDDTGTLIRVYDGTTVIQEFLAERVTRNQQGDLAGQVTISGPDLADVFNRTVVYPYDYPDNPSAFPDHIWGGDNLLSNGDFEDGVGTKDSVEVYVDASGGTWTITVDGDASNAIDFDATARQVELAMQDGITAVNDVYVAGTGAVQVNELYNDGTSGTFTITADGQTTGAIAYNAAASAVATALEALSNVTDVSVTGAGTSGDPWIIRWNKPGVVDELSATDPTGGTSTLSTSQSADPYEITFHDPADVGAISVQAGSLTGTPSVVFFGDSTSASAEAGSWTVSMNGDQSIEPLIHGSSSISVVTTPVDTGTYALRITASSQFGGAQQIVAVEPGGIYQASIRIRSTGTGPFRFVIRDIYENLIAVAPGAGGEFTVTANTWTTVTISDVEIPAGVEAIMFRIAYVGTSSQTFYVDNAEFNEGLAASNAGEIVTALMDDAASDHSSDTRGAPLSWIDYTGFDDTNDSSSNAWAEDLSITAYATMTYGQFFDSLVELGYEWRLAPKASPGATTHDLEWYISGNMGTDYTSSVTPAITFGQATIGGPVVKRIPAYTRVLALGAEGLFTESADATAVTNFGRLEVGRNDPGWSSSTTLSAAATELLDADSRNRIAVQVNVVATDDHPRPLVDYLPGDTMYFQMPPALTRSGRRVRAIAWTHQEPTLYQITGSRVFQGESGTYEAVRRLLREFKRPTPRGRGSVNLGGGVIPWLVAASDSNDMYKKAAQYVCAGSDDQVTIQRAIDVASQSEEGEIWLAPGTYSVNAFAGNFALSADCTIVGIGRNSNDWPAAAIVAANSVGSEIIELGGGSLINIYVEASGATNCVYGLGVENVTIRNCYLYSDTGSSLHIDNSFDNVWVEDNYFLSGGDPVIEFGNINNLVFTGNYIAANGGALLKSGTAYAWSIANNFFERSHVELDCSVDGANGNVHVLHNTFSEPGESGADVAAIEVTGGDSTSPHVLIQGNYLDQYTNGAGIRIEDLWGGIIRDNRIAKPGHHGIWLIDSSRCRVGSNTIGHPDVTNSSGFPATNNTYDAIHLSGNSDANQIIDNHLMLYGSATKVWRYGINIGTATCDDNAVIGNNFGGSADYGTGPYNDAGTSTQNAYTGGAVGDNISY